MGTILRTQMPTGPLSVGCSDIMLGKTKDGTLMRIFYPTSAVLPPQPDPEVWTRWHLGKEYGLGIGRYSSPPLLHSLFGWMFNWQTRNVLTPSVWCGDLLNSPKKFPVIVFSHGLIANRSLYSSICSQLASHGFFVAALEHRDGSASNTFVLTESGEQENIPHDHVKAAAGDFSLRSKQIKVRIEEACKTLTALEKLNDGGLKNELEHPFDLDQLKDKLDFSCPIMAGHSFGGCTTIGAMAKDKRFKLGIALDPWMYPIKDKLEEICPKVDQPILCISTESFQTHENLSSMSKLPEENSNFVTIKGTVHQNQTDSPFVLGAHGRFLGGARSSLHFEVAMSVNNKLMLSFIDTHQGLPKDIIGSSHSEDLAKYVQNHKELFVPTLYGKGKKMLGWDGKVKV